MYQPHLTDKQNSNLADYIRFGFDISSKSRKPNHTVFVENPILDSETAILAVNENLLEQDGIKLTDKGFTFLCHLKS